MNCHLIVLMELGHDVRSFHTSIPVDLAAYILKILHARHISCHHLVRDYAEYHRSVGMLTRLVLGVLEVVVAVVFDVVDAVASVHFDSVVLNREYHINCLISAGVDFGHSDFVDVNFEFEWHELDINFVLERAVRDAEADLYLSPYCFLRKLIAIDSNSPL